MRSESLVRCLLPFSVAGCRSAPAIRCSRCSEGVREVREGEARERRSNIEADREVVIREGEGKMIWAAWCGEGVIFSFRTGSAGQAVLSPPDTCRQPVYGWGQAGKQETDANIPRLLNCTVGLQLK